MSPSWSDSQNVVDVVLGVGSRGSREKSVPTGTLRPLGRVGCLGWPPFGPFATVLRYDAGLMIRRIREMPGGIRIFLVYALLILAGIGLSLRYVVDTAISAPVSPEGIVVMVLLAYTICTTTLVLQRKQAARGLALGLASLTVPLIPLLLLSQLIVEAVFVAALSLAMFRGLLRGEVRTYLNEP